MARKAPTAAALAASRPAAHSGMAPWLQGLACGVLLIVATPTALLCTALLLPTVMAMLSEHQPGRPVSRVVMLFGLAGSCTPFSALWRAGHTMPDALALVSDIRVLAIAWSAQGVGWLLSQLVPLLLGLLGEQKTRIEIARLQKRREALWEEWHSPE
jgi:hypothetical protein